MQIAADGKHDRMRLSRCARRSVLLLSIGLVTALGPSACTVRSPDPVIGPDSTLVYPSRLNPDVNASITFALRDSRAREEERVRDRERQREIQRLQKDRRKLLDLREDQAKEQARRARLAAEKERKAAERAKKSKKGERSKKGKKSAKGRESGSEAPPRDGSVAVTDAGAGSSRSEGSDLALSPAVIEDSLQAIDRQLRQLAAEDSAAKLVPWKLRKAQGLPEDERAFDLEEDARVLGVVRLENVHARGSRPLTFHLVWLNSAQKRVFKKIYEYVPNDSTRTLTGSFSIPPSRRTPGFYTLQVYLFRERIAQKSFELRGSGVEVPEGGGGEGAM